MSNKATRIPRDMIDQVLQRRGVTRTDVSAAIRYEGDYVLIDESHPDWAKAVAESAKATNPAEIPFPAGYPGRWNWWYARAKLPVADPDAELRMIPQLGQGCGTCEAHWAQVMEANPPTREIVTDRDAYSRYVVDRHSDVNEIRKLPRWTYEQAERAHRLRLGHNVEPPPDPLPGFGCSPSLIPKIFHWVFIGDKPLPEKYARWMQSWRAHHPDWKCIVWCNVLEGRAMDGFEFLPLPPLVNQSVYDGIERWVSGRAAIAARSDIIRMEVVTRLGGVYLDTDVECFGSIDQILGGVRLFIADEHGPAKGNFMFGSAPNHPAMWTAVRELEPHLRNKKPMNATKATGPQYLGRRLPKHPDCVLFPSMLFNPLAANQDPDQVEQWPAVSLANHHFDGFWYDRPQKAKPGPMFQRDYFSPARTTT